MAASILATFRRGFVLTSGQQWWISASETPDRKDQDNLENQENIETTYRKSPTKVLAGGETDASPINEDTPEKEGDVEPTNEFTVKEIKLGLN